MQKGVVVIAKVSKEKVNKASSKAKSYTKEEVAIHFHRTQNKSETARYFGIKSSNTVKNYYDELQKDKNFAKKCNEIVNKEKKARLENEITFIKSFGEVLDNQTQNTLQRICDEMYEEDTKAQNSAYTLKILADIHFKQQEIELKREEVSIRKQQLAIEREKLELLKNGNNNSDISNKVVIINDLPE